MKSFAFDLQAQSPLAIRSDHAQEGSETARYISGSTLAGSLAALHRQVYPDNRDEFSALFLRGLVQFPMLYPASFQNSGMQDSIGLPVYPLPKTAQTCKRYQGFRDIFSGEEDDEGSRHGVRDSLFDWALFSLADQAKIAEPDVLLAPFQEYKECPVCGNALDHFDGYYRREKEDGRMMHARLDTRLQTHNGISRFTGTSQEGILYNRRVFQEGSRFWGKVQLQDEFADALQHFIEEVGNTGLVRIGTGRSRGMGMVHIGVEEIEESPQRFQERLAKFNALLHTRLEQVLPVLAAANTSRYFFALTLHSPAILQDPLLRYRGLVDESVLAELSGLPKESLKLIYSNASLLRVTGWNELWGTPKLNVLAIDTGSCFLFASMASQSELEEKLFKLEEEGIGQRRAEGFGRVCISDAFHREVKLR